MQTAFAYINIDSVLIEDLRRWMVAWNVAIKLVSVFVPLDRVQRLAVHIKVTLEPDRVVADDVIWYSNFGQSQRFGEF